MSEKLPSTWHSEEGDQAQLRQLSHESHPLVTLLRQFVINKLTEDLNEKHQQSSEVQDSPALMGSHGFGGDYAQGLCVHGSSGLPPNLRAAGDLDLTVNMGMGYNYEKQRCAFYALLFAVATGRHDMEFIEANMGFQTRALQRLREEKAVAMGYVRTHISTQDIGLITDYLCRLFDFSQADMAVLAQFNAQSIAAIVSERKREALQKGSTYAPTQEEEAGTGLSIVTQVGLYAKDRLNIFSSLGMSRTGTAFTERDGKALGHLTYAHPLEEIADKFFAVLTKARAVVDEPHAKDLLDLYLRTKTNVKPCRSWSAYQHGDRQAIIDMIRVSWPAHPGFHDDELYFSRTDPSLSKTVKEVGDGLLKLKEHGVITPQTFGVEVTPANAGHYAKILLDHAWQLCAECMGVVREGSNKHPTYRLHPPQAVEDYWAACRDIHRRTTCPSGAAPVDEREKAATESDLRNKITALLQGRYGERDQTNISRAGAINAYAGADSGRAWKGFAPGI